MRLTKNPSPIFRPSLLPVVLSGLLLAACGPRSTEPAAVYTTRAKVVELSGSGEDQRVTMKHEAIPAFKDRYGTAAEMPSMAMAFGIAPQVDATAFKPGSQWALTFDVAWQREPALRITEAKPLPAETKLALPE